MLVESKQSPINIDEFLQRWKERRLKAFEIDLNSEIAGVKALFDEYYSCLDDFRTFSVNHGKSPLWFYQLLRSFDMPMKPIPIHVLKRIKRNCESNRKFAETYLCNSEDCWVCRKIKKELIKGT